MNFRSFLTFLALLAAVFLFPVRDANAKDTPRKELKYFMKLPTDEAAQRRFFTNLELVTQEGRPIRFYDDILKDKVVLIDFIFTHCEHACPANSQIFSQVQSALADQMEEKLRLVSISVDPKRDTPRALTEFASQFDAGKGWTFLTGKKENLDKIIKKLGQFNQDVEAHSPMFILGNVKTGHWRIVRGNFPPQGLVTLLKLLLSKK
ncbi:MAG: SCO family protein [Nitrospinaceae bacterium]